MAQSVPVVNEHAGSMTSQRYGDRVVIYYNGDRYYYCGTWGAEPTNGNGRRGDVRVRPVHMGPGKFTYTVNGFEDGDLSWEQ